MSSILAWAVTVVGLQQRRAESREGAADAEEEMDAKLHRAVQAIVLDIVPGSQLAADVERAYRAHGARRAEEWSRDPASAPACIQVMVKAGDAAVAEWQARRGVKA